jgi:hypothetical protein
VASRSAFSPEIVQATGDLQRTIRQAFGEVAKLIFGNATDLDPGDGMFHPHADPRQLPVVPFLAGRQWRLLGLFFGWRGSRTVEA